MDPRLHGVPISATHMAAPSVPGIRAPLTVDESNFEYSVSPRSRRNSTTSSYYSGSELEAEGFVSGEDEFETASERPYVTDQDEEVLEETHFLKDYAFSRPSLVKPIGEIVHENSNSVEHGISRPSVRNPDEAFARESGNVSANAVYRPSVRKLDERIYKGNNNTDESDGSRSFLSESDDELVAYEDYVVNRDNSSPPVVVTDEEVSENGQIEVVDIKSPVVQRLHIPIALLSGDSDDDSQSNDMLEHGSFSGIVRVPSVEVLHRINSAPKVRMMEADDDSFQAENQAGVDFVGDLSINNPQSIVVLEDENFSGIVRVPSIEVLHRINSAPKVRMMESDEEDDDSYSQAENQVEVDFLGDLLITNGIVDSKDEKEQIGVDDNIYSVISADVIQAKGPDVNEEAEAISLVVKEESNQIPELEKNVEPMHLDEEIQETNVIDDRKAFIDLVDNEETTDIVEGAVFPGNISSIASSAELGCNFVGEKPSEVEVTQLGSNRRFSAVSLDDDDGKSSDSLEDNLMRNQDIQIENPEDETKGWTNIKEIPKEAQIIEELPVDVQDSTFHTVTEALVAEMERGRDSTSLSNEQSLLDHHTQEVDDHIMTQLDEWVDADGGTVDPRQTIDSAALAAFFKAVRGATSDGDIENLFPERDSDPITEARHPDLSMPPSANDELEPLSELEKHQLEKIQQIQVRYLRLLERLGRSTEDSVASKILYQLTIAEARFSRAFDLDSAREPSVKLEAQKKDNFDFSLCILVIGKTGVGKSATINSLFGERKTEIDAFEPATTRVKEIIGTINGVKVKVFDTPGLRTSQMEQSINRKVLSSIKKLMQKTPPDVILYVDRLDTQPSNLNDLPLLKSVTSYLGSSIWRKSIVALTHATSIPPDGPNGYPLSYEVFVARRSQVVHQLISHSSGQLLLMNPGSMIPVSVVENHPSGKENGSGETPLHNGESWRSQLLLLCYSMKILSETSSLLATHNPFDNRKLFDLWIRPPALSYFLSSLLQPNIHPELSNDRSIESFVSDIELGSSSDSDQEEDTEYDNLPPFKPLKKSQIAKLSREQRKSYFEEYDYRVKLLHRMREEMRRFKDLKKTKNGFTNETDQEIDAAPETEAVPLLDMALPPSFDGGNPSYRYRFLETSTQLLTRPVLDCHGWDHDYGFDGVLIEDKVDIATRFPALISVQLTKDKEELNIQLHSSVSAKHEDKGATMAGLDIQTLGKKLAYILKGESKIKNFRKNITAAGVSVTFLDENVVYGFKVVDHVRVGKQLVLMGNAGVVRSQDDDAYGMSFDLCRRHEDYTIGRGQTSMGLSVMRHRGGLTCECKLESQFCVGRNSEVSVSAGLNNRLSGQVSVKTRCSDQLQIAALALLPIASAIFKKVFGQTTEV